MAWMMDVFKNRGESSPKMEGENHGSKPYEQMDDLEVPLVLETPLWFYGTSPPQSKVVHEGPVALRGERQAYPPWN